MTVAAGVEAQLQAFAEAHGLASIDDFLSFPKYLQIETVSLCNARCVMCPIELWRREQRTMDDELFGLLLDQIAPRVDWLGKLTLQLDGEPLLDKRLDQRVAALKAVGVKAIALSSNASLMTAEWAERLLDAGVDEVSFSLDGATAATFEAIRVRLKFDQCVQHVEQFIALRNRRQAPTAVRVRMTVQPANAAEYRAFVDYWAARLGPGDSCYGKLLHDWGGWRADLRAPEGFDTAGLDQRACTSPFSSLVVLSDGRVPLCCCDFNAGECSGNARETPLAELWRGAALEAARAAHRREGRAGLAMCRGCNTWDPASKLPGWPPPRGHDG